MIELPSELDDDSEDLTDAEVEHAIIVQSEDKLVAHLRSARCTQCAQPIETQGHALRRRAPFMYGRMTLVCAQRHEQPIVFRLEWLHGSS